jgi:hypothetical protein
MAKPKLWAGLTMSTPNIMGEKHNPNDLAMLLTPFAALRSSGLTIVATKVCLAEIFIFPMLNLRIIMKIVRDFVGMSGIRIIVRLAGMWVISMVDMAPWCLTRRLERTPPREPRILHTMRMVPIRDYGIDHYLENQKLMKLFTMNPPAKASRANSALSVRMILQLCFCLIPKSHLSPL